jgi:hypothetical protein
MVTPRRTWCGQFVTKSPAFKCQWQRPCLCRDTELAASGQGLPARLLPSNPRKRGLRATWTFVAATLFTGRRFSKKWSTFRCSSLVVVDQSGLGKWVAWRGGRLSASRAATKQLCCALRNGHPRFFAQRKMPHEFAFLRFLILFFKNDDLLTIATNDGQ